ncbi:MAG TPA: hypothetical protein VFE35_08000 [Candidatus Cybelea sp.]|jgi:hypothetical protein|nr:hypothetical protein [Candidatus Cybelea sp.]
MLRYLLASTVIVVGTAVLATAWANRDLIRLKIASISAHGPAKAGASGVLQPKPTLPLHGDAPWALSALPECFSQLSESTGSPSYVRAHLPKDAVPIVQPARLAYGDCTIAVAGDEAYVRRGDDRLRIPPHVQFYRAARLLALIRWNSRGAELRVYQPAQ